MYYAIKYGYIIKSERFVNYCNINTILPYRHITGLLFLLEYVLNFNIIINFGPGTKVHL